MEPSLTLDPLLAPVLQELRQLEPLIYAANDGKTRAHFEALLAPNFWEVGASGKRYSRAFVLGVLEERQRLPREEPWQAIGHHVQAVAPELYLLTYTLLQATRASRRATLWRCAAPDRWQMVYHQGTVVVPDGA